MKSILFFIVSMVVSSALFFSCPAEGAMCGIPIHGIVRIDIPQREGFLPGVPASGDTLTADVSALIGSGEVSFQWRRANVPVPDSNRSTFVLGDGDVGKAFSVIAFMRCHTGAIVSDPTFPVLNPAAHLAGIAGTAAVAITGEARTGATLAAVIDDASIADRAFFQWRRARAGETVFAAIHGADGSTYTLRQLDAGHTIKVIVGHPDHVGFLESEATAFVVRD